MEQVYLIIAMVTAGVSLVSGLINLLNGLHRDGERMDLIFGLLALSIFTFLMLPPVGFILFDEVPRSGEIIFKRIFIYSFYILLPWFIELYSGYKQRILSYLIGIIFISSFLMMIFEQVETTNPMCFRITLVPLAMILYVGLRASIFQINSGQRSAGRWLFSAMGIYGILYFLLLGTFTQAGNNYFRKILGTELFFPFHFNLLAFLVIMSVRLRANTFEKYRLEKILRWTDSRWNSLVQNMELLIVELDQKGTIKYLNPHAIQVLGYGSPSDLVNRNWFKTVTYQGEQSLRENIFLESVRDGKILPHFVSKIVSKNGQPHMISWTNVLVYDDHSRPSGAMSIGFDITEQENAYDQVQNLKNELEKENLQLKGKILVENNEHNIVGQSDSLKYALQKAKQVASTNAAVLLEGETGVGKELFADFIHKESFRRNGPLIKVNCAGFPPELMESELFGHEKGSFTGAAQLRKGRFELADGGTLFLDEIGELPITLQPKLLRVLQNGEFERIGGQQTIKVDVRVISATNRDLLNQIENHQFREDLFYRLNVFPITIPPLRSRREDISLLFTHFVKRFSEEHQKSIDNISKADMTRLTEYSWPGNVRELTNVIERSIISSPGNTLKLEWINGKSSNGTNTNEPLSMEEIERAHFLKVLESCQWKINGDDGAAAKLGLNPNTLRSRLKKLSISRNGHGNSVNP